MPLFADFNNNLIINLTVQIFHVLGSQSLCGIAHCGCCQFFIIDARKLDQIRTRKSQFCFDRLAKQSVCCRYIHLQFNDDFTDLISGA